MPADPKPRAAEIIEAFLAKMYRCSCDKAYTGRGLVAPDCTYHEVKGDGIDIACDLEVAGLLAPPVEVTAEDVREGEHEAFLRDARLASDRHKVVAKVISERLAARQEGE